MEGLALGRLFWTSRNNDHQKCQRGLQALEDQIDVTDVLE